MLELELWQHTALSSGVKAGPLSCASGPLPRTARGVVHLEDVVHCWLCQYPKVGGGEEKAHWHFEVESKLGQWSSTIFMP